MITHLLCAFLVESCTLWIWSIGTCSSKLIGTFHAFHLKNIWNLPPVTSPPAFHISIFYDHSPSLESLPEHLSRGHYSFSKSKYHCCPQSTIHSPPNSPNLNDVFNHGFCLDLASYSIPSKFLWPLTSPLQKSLLDTFLTISIIFNGVALCSVGFAKSCQRPTFGVPNLSLYSCTVLKESCIAGGTS